MDGFNSSVVVLGNGASLGRCVVVAILSRVAVFVYVVCGERVVFAVFGVTRENAQIAAAKICPAYHTDRSAMSQTEYQQKLFELTETLFFEGKTKQLSPIYANMKEAEHYKKLAKKSGAKDLDIKVKVTDHKGKTSVLTGKQRSFWAAT